MSQDLTLSKLTELVNLLSMKRVDYYNISGRADSNGEICCRLNYLHEYDRNISFYGSIESFEFSALIPNLKKVLMTSSIIIYQIVARDIK